MNPVMPCIIYTVRTPIPCKSYYKGKLSQGRIERLDSSIGFTWDPLEETWMARFDELRQYTKQHGDSNVPQSQG